VDTDAMNAATTVVSILRGEETNDYGDTVDSQVAVASGIPAAIIESTRRVYLPAEGAHRIVRSFAARMPANTTVLKGDRLRDQRTGATYKIVDLHSQTSPTRILDVVVDLERTT
jgi:hypothetical protein